MDCEKEISGDGHPMGEALLQFYWTVKDVVERES